MKTLSKFLAIALTATFLSGCTGTVMNAERNCSYFFFLHPAISISRLIEGCGPATKS